MHSRRSFLHFGIALTAAFAAGPASAARSTAYHGSARSGGRVIARDDAALSFTAVRRNRPWTYHVSDSTKYLIAGKPAAWSDVEVGSRVHIRWRRRAGQRHADVVSIRPK
jgi:hypothetical protein